MYVSGFEHFDVLHLVDGDFGIARGKKVEIVNAILQSPLQRALHAGNVAEFRRCALQLVGITHVGDESDEESSTEESAHGSDSEGSLDGSDASSTLTSTSESADDVKFNNEVAEKPMPSKSIQSSADDNEVDEDMPDMPSGSNTLLSPLKGQKKFCSAFNVRGSPVSYTHLTLPTICSV